jgi:UDP-3-O-[3-hydroxymyristoyl] glucosamine N-acyltransferase
MKFSELVETLGVFDSSSLSEHNADDPDLIGVARIGEAKPGTISYIESRKFAKYLQHTQASAVILAQDEQLQMQARTHGLAWIATADPRLLFARAIALFYQPFRPDPGIHPTAWIDPSVQIGENVSIGPYVVLQPGVFLGDDVCIHPHVVIYPDVHIGDRTVLHANCVIHERARIGSDCVIHSGAAIGSEGFGFVPTTSGWIKMEQSGFTVLENGVEVGCNSTIDRPAVGETRIQHHTKIDNQVHIGHDCEVGSNCIMAAQVGLAGGVKVGDRVILAGQVGISNRVTIGSDSTATARAGIIRDVEPGSVISGHPAIPHRQWLKVSTIQGHLPELMKKGGGWRTEDGGQDA